MPWAFVAAMAKSRLSIFPSKSARWNDHWAREILNHSLPAARETGAPREASPTAAATRPLWARKARRSVFRIPGIIHYFVPAAAGLDAPAAAAEAARRTDHRFSSHSSRVTLRR